VQNCQWKNRNKTDEMKLEKIPRCHAGRREREKRDFAVVHNCDAPAGDADIGAERVNTIVASPCCAFSGRKVRRRA